MGITLSEQTSLGSVPFLITCFIYKRNCSIAKPLDSLGEFMAEEFQWDFFN